MSGVIITPLFLSMVNYFENQITHIMSGTLVHLMSNNKLICKRKDWSQSQFNSGIYIWVEYSEEVSHLGWGIQIKGIKKYVGFFKNFDKNKILSNRPFTHKKDLLSESINDNYMCYCILGLSENEARSLEAILISQVEGLLNKRRELKWERLANEYLNLELQWK